MRNSDQLELQPWFRLLEAKDAAWKLVLDTREALAASDGAPVGGGETYELDGCCLAVLRLVA